MTYHARAHRTDGNHSRISRACREVGATTLDISTLPGAGDLLVGYHGQNILIEIKNRDGRGRRLTESEKEFRENWRGQPPIIVETELDALRAIGALAE